ncbi:MAG: 5'-nucleotidase C-terminal domain-containing protein [Candidatus Eisenbacteria bacterium]|nr:5'-nucleotidase C-terminal domain-containing protein [Candidatus Eisenbacteria bacterium]
MRTFLLRCLALCLVTAGLATSAHADQLTVRVLHTTDLHGALSAWDDVRDVAAPRGLEKLASMISAARADSTPTLLVDAGDALFGSALVRAWREGSRSTSEPVIAALNALGYDALAVGNHEFDGGRVALDSARAHARFPFLAANVVDARTGRTAYGTSVVREFAGARIGIVGLTTPAVPMLMDTTLCAGLLFLDPIETARREVARLRGAERCQAVIVLFHSGLERDPAAKGGEAKPRIGEVPNENMGYRLAYEVQGIDALVLGHTHVVVPSVMIGKTLVTQAGRNGEALGRIELRFTRATPMQEWTLAMADARVTSVTDSIATDPGMQTLVAPYAQQARTLLDEVVANTRMAITAPDGRFGDNVLLQLIHRCQLDASGADVSLAAMFDPSQRIEPGPITRRDLLRLYPYDNSLGVVELSGAELKATLEHAASMLNDYVWDGRSPLLKPEAAGYQFDTAYGVDYEIDLTRPAGSRIVNLMWKGKPLDPAQKLKVVANSYRLAGGGDYLELRRARRVWSTNATMPELLLSWIKKQDSLGANAASHWTLLPEHAGTPERELIDRLARQGVAPKADLLRFGAQQPVQRHELTAWLDRAFARKPARAAAGVTGTPATVAMALDACERAARAQGYALAGKTSDPSFRRGLLTGVSRSGKLADKDQPLTRAQWLGMLSNLRFPTLHVLETTDFHGAILGGTRDRRTQRPTGGSAALAAAIAKERAKNPEGTVLLDGGDIFQGTMISNLQYGRPVVEQMNALGYTAAAVGNHEFDWGIDTLVSRVHGMRFSALGANMFERKTNKLPRWARSDTTVQRRGLQVGIVGLAYPGTPSVTLATNVAHLRFDDDSTVAARVSQQLRKRGAAVVLGVGHIPAETDSLRRARGDLARLGRITTVDAWLGGHSHNVVDDTVEGRPVLIAGAQGQYLVVLDLVVDAVARKVIESDGRVDFVYADLPVDSAWTARVERWNANVAPVAATVLGDLATPLHRRRPESTIGDFICDAMRASTQSDIALQNPGGMRADMDAGPITRGDVYAVMPFDNSIVTLELTGDLVKLAIEQALRGERITQVSGIRFVIDNGRPELDKLTNLTLADGTPFDLKRTYKVAVNNFMATGGDRYDALTQGKNKTDTGILIRDAMEQWVKTQCAGGKTLSIPGDGRITQTGR